MSVENSNVLMRSNLLVKSNRNLLEKSNSLVSSDNSLEKSNPLVRGVFKVGRASILTTDLL